MLAGITLLVAASIDALGIYFYNWPGSSLIFVFVLGFIAYLIGLKIEARAQANAEGRATPQHLGHGAPGTIIWT
jgi:hypothetical protein